MKQSSDSFNGSHGTLTDSPHKFTERKHSNASDTYRNEDWCSEKLPNF